MHLKSNDYSKFKLRPDNRPVGESPHLERLKNSIKMKNLLHLRPITVNENMEILDGQHRYEAAKALGLDIYYEIAKNADPYDMVLMNITKPWNHSDFMNYFVKNNFPEYVKFAEFIRKHQIPIALGLKLVTGRSSKSLHDFKLGKFRFNYEEKNQQIEICKDTVTYIRKIHGPAAVWSQSNKFWISMMQICELPGFNKEKWFKHLRALIKSCQQKVKIEDYYDMLLKIYNNPILNQE